MIDSLQYCGKGVVIHPSVHLEFPDKIRIDNFCRLHYGAILVAESSLAAGLMLGPGVTVREYAYLNSYNGFIVLGRNSYIGQSSVICGHGGIEIGENSMVSQLCSVTASTHIFDDVDVPLRFQGETSKGIRIGSNVWIAARVSILDGVTIGDHAVVATGSVVTRDVPAWSVASGYPAKILYDRRRQHHDAL